MTGTDMTIDDVAIARWRLRAQHLVAPFAGSAHDVIRSLLAVQAENAGQAEWAVAARTRRRNPSDLARLLDEGVVVRTHVLRPTWHFVCAEDLGWLLDLTGPRVQRVTGQQLRTVHGLDDAAVDRAVSVVVEAIGANGALTRSQLGEELASRGVSGRGPSGGGQFLMILLAHAELAGLICSGRRVDGEHTYARLSDRAPSARRLDRDEALAELALRYMTGHGPATERDLAYWASLTLGQARRGLDQVRDRLERFDHGGRTYWHAPGQAPSAGPIGVAASRASAADSRRVLPRLPGLPLGSRRRGNRSSLPRTSHWDGARRRPAGCVRPPHGHCGARALRHAAIPTVAIGRDRRAQRGRQPLRSVLGARTRHRHSPPPEIVARAPTYARLAEGLPQAASAAT